MKKILICSLFILIGLNAFSQNLEVQERMVTIAVSEEDQFNLIDFPTSELKIEKKINWILKPDVRDFDLGDPELIFEVGKGWFLQYQFNTPLNAVIYKEKLQLVDSRLVISESREAMMAKANNCEVLEFTNDDDRCKCATKKDQTLDATVTYRLFSSTY